ncbi:hypothetical protein LR48_Vigan03g083600 [Vigna angularis]|uniref:Uncharacterized protein n=1 Tax=Phaseolus angularis TaxID=3914 RepID=A0A0L9U501_PHAAN|nr:hypothetical protein LR48_Vigan03g083600 [Vigna angularis]
MRSSFKVGRRLKSKRLDFIFLSIGVSNARCNYFEWVNEGHYEIEGSLQRKSEEVEVYMEKAVLDLRKKKDKLKRKLEQERKNLKMITLKLSSIMTLCHPSLITHLCEIAGVDTSLPPFEKPRKTIDRSYYLQYCLIDEDGQNITAPQPPRRHRRNQPDPPAQPEEDGPQNPFNMADLNAKLEALHRMGLAHADMMRQVYASSHPGFMTSEEYATRVAWPGDQTSTDGGAGTSSGAQAMEES